MSEVYFVAVDKNVPFIDMLRILMGRVGIGNVNGVVALKAHMGDLKYELIKV